MYKKRFHVKSISFYRVKHAFHQFYKIFDLIKRFHFDVENNTTFSVLLHYSCKKNNGVVAKGHFTQQNSTCMRKCTVFSIAERKNTLPLTKIYHQSIFKQILFS